MKNNKFYKEDWLEFVHPLAEKLLRMPVVKDSLWQLFRLFIYGALDLVAKNPHVECLTLKTIGRFYIITSEKGNLLVKFKPSMALQDWIRDRQELLPKIKVEELASAFEKERLKGYHEMPRSQLMGELHSLRDAIEELPVQLEILINEKIEEKKAYIINKDVDISKELRNLDI